MFEGVACRKCGATMRYESSRGCVACTRQRTTRRQRATHWAHCRAEVLRHNALRRGIAYELTAEEATQLYTAARGQDCPACGHAMLPRTRHAPSVDRVHNAVGYRLSNVVVLCNRCNTLKSDVTGEELKRLADYVLAMEELAV